MLDYRQSNITTEKSRTGYLVWPDNRPFNFFYLTTKIPFNKQTTHPNCILIDSFETKLIFGFLVGYPVRLIELAMSVLDPV